VLQYCEACEREQKQRVHIDTPHIIIIIIIIALLLPLPTTCCR
jgi:uncharacterized protein (DUF983 family)